MINKAVKIEFKLVPKSRWEGSEDNWYVYVYEPAYRKDGSMYPFVIDVKSVVGKSKKKVLEQYIKNNYSNIVDNLDETPLVV